MGIALIKKINEKTPYWMKKPFAKIIRAKLINNKTFLETYRLLEQSDLMTSREKEEWQLKRAKELLAYAYEHTSYYHELFDKMKFNPAKVEKLMDIQRLPILKKKDLADNLDAITADNISDYYTVTTGGSSGEPIKVLMEKSAIYKEWAFVYHYWSKFGYDFSNSKLATFRGVDMDSRICEENPLYNEIRMNPFIMSQLNIKEYLSKIEKFGADFIYGYPSVVYNFCRLADERGLQLKDKFKAALLISENLYPFQEELITRVLGCKIAMFYGHSERATFAEKYENGYKFNSFYGITEISDKGEPIVTGFINEKTPLIRYLVDDMVEPGATENCKIWGHRDSDVLIGRNGEQFRASMLDFHGMLSGKFGEFQFIQNFPGEVIICVCQNRLLQNNLSGIVQECQRRLGSGFTCRLEYVEHLTKTPRGKYKLVIQNWKEE